MDQSWAYSNAKRSVSVSYSQTVQVAQDLIHEDADDPRDGDATKSLCLIPSRHCSPGKSHGSHKSKELLATLQSYRNTCLFQPSPDSGYTDVKGQGRCPHGKNISGLKVLPHVQFGPRQQQLFTSSKVFVISQDILQQRV